MTEIDRRTLGHLALAGLAAAIRHEVSHRAGVTRAGGVPQLPVQPWSVDEFDGDGEFEEWWGGY